MHTRTLYTTVHRRGQSVLRHQPLSEGSCSDSEAMATPAAKSIVWKYFSVDTKDRNRVICNLCNKSLSRGGKEDKYHNTSDMTKHVKSRHKEEFDAAEKTAQEEQEHLHSKRKLDAFFSSPVSKSSRGASKNPSPSTSASTGMYFLCLLYQELQFNFDFMLFCDSLHSSYIPSYPNAMMQ